MPPKRVEWLDRIKIVEREHAAIRIAARRLLADVEGDPTIAADAGLRPRDVQFAAARAEPTYIIRLFAEFETGLRLCWAVVRGSDPPSRTRDLIDGIAALRHIGDYDRVGVHEVREYRNSLVHEREEPVNVINITESRHRLCRFFSHLPLDW